MSVSPLSHTIFCVPHRLRRLAVVLLFVTAVWPSLGYGQTANGMINVTITGSGQGRFKMALAQPIGGDPAMASQLQELMRQNLAILPIVDLLPDAAILGGTALNAYQGDAIDFHRFQLAGANYVVTTGWPAPGTVELRIYDAFSRALLVGKQFTGLAAATLPKVADRFCGSWLESLHLSGDLFRASLAFVAAGTNRNVFAARPTGRDKRQITNLNGQCMSPAWSPDARSIAFTHLSNRYNSLGVWSGGQVRTQRYPGNLVIGPFYLASGQLVASIAVKPSPGIYLLGSNLQPAQTLVEDNSINTSPRFDRSGSRMVFVSDRYGSPQIMLRDGSGIRRLTTGGWNTDPTISPDGTMVAFTRQTGGGHRLFRIDLTTGMETQISFGPGSDEQPAFLTDSYFVAFTSSRAGAKQLYLTTKDGLEPKPLPLGGATFPAWGLTEAP
ncbi:MAG: translocation protein TolB [Desulfovibrio sp.]|nr:translocation protein TolB [Desulfovibrio sp.]